MHRAFTSFVERLQGFIRQASPAEPAAPAQDDASFNQLALELFSLQFEHVPAYRRFCQHRQITPANLERWNDIPVVPVAAFKELELTSLAPQERTRVFRSSGTSTHRPSCHIHGTVSLAIYEASLLPWFRAHLLPEAQSLRLISLTPPVSQAPHSSLAYMLDTVARAATAPDAWFLGSAALDTQWHLDPVAVLAQLQEAAAASQPLLLVGTAYGLVQLLDHVQAQCATVALPAGSRIMETGGYKGRTRTLPKRRLHQLLTRHFAVPETHLVSEYGMSELSSQAYDHVAGQPLPSGARRFQFPPWARAMVLNPENGRSAPEATAGLVAVLDLANVASVMAVLTDDLGRGGTEGFELLGRAPASEPRGCSLLQA